MFGKLRWEPIASRPEAGRCGRILFPPKENPAEDELRGANLIKDDFRPTKPSEGTNLERQPDRGEPE